MRICERECLYVRVCVCGVCVCVCMPERKKCEEETFDQSTKGKRIGMVRTQVAGDGNKEREREGAR